MNRSITSYIYTHKSHTYKKKDIVVMRHDQLKKTSINVFEERTKTKKLHYSAR